MKYICKVCGYIYDPAENDGIELPDNPDYVCPVCGAPISEFEPLED